jgi:FMN phosphatase YigB (HAD superfamily)
MNKAFVFDFDDTVAITDCCVIVRNADGNVVERLTPKQYNSYKLKSLEYFDYTEFKQVINPRATFVMALAQEVHAENHDCYILTARSSAAADGIREFLMSNGIIAKEIICIGDNAGEIAAEKRKVLLSIVQGYDKVYFYDDDKHNVEQAKTIGVKANLV